MFRIKKEKKLISKLFDDTWYQEFYNIQEADLKLHFLKKGCSLGYNPNPYFNTEFYQKTYNTKGVCPLVHYIKTADTEFNNPNENFNTRWYLNTYKDVKESKMNPLEHFIYFGKKEGRATSSEPVYCGDAFLDGQDKKKNSSITVTILCRTYNHEEFISKALDGFIMQKTNFNYEVLIGDDISTDNTVKIIKKYIKKYPKILKLVKRDHNLGPVKNLMDLTQKVKSPYVAICEGDDYWIDPYKLQRQVDFLNQNEDYSICYHKVIINNIDSDKENIISGQGIGETTTFNELLRVNHIHMNSVMYRWAFPKGLTEENFNSKAMPADWQLHLHHALKGNIKRLDNVMGVYNRHSEGIWSDSANPIELYMKFGIRQIEFFKTFEHVKNDKFVKLQKEKQIRLFKTLSNHYIDNELYSQLLELIHAYPDLYKEVFDNFNLNTDTLDISTSKTLEKTLKEQITVTVIVTSYNHSKYIGQALDSILLQKGCFNLNIIIGDDLSPDNTLEILQEYQSKFPNIISVLDTPKNLGMRYNMKRCFNAVTGNFVAICEGDDYWISPKKLQIQLSFLRQNNDCEMCFNQLLLYREEKGIFQVHPQQDAYQKTSLTLEDLSKTPIIGNFSGCIYRALSIKKIPDKYYDDPIGFDWLFNMNIAKHGNIGFIKELLSVYRIHEGGQWSANSAEIMQEKIKKSQENFLNYFPELNLSFPGELKPESYTELNRKKIERLHYHIDKLEILVNKLSISGWVYEKIKHNLTRKIPKGFCLIDNQTHKIVKAVIMKDIMRKDVEQSLIKTYKVNPLCGFNDTINIDLNTSHSYNLAFFIIQNNTILIKHINKSLYYSMNIWRLKDKEMK